MERLCRALILVVFYTTFLHAEKTYAQFEKKMLDGEISFLLQDLQKLRGTDRRLDRIDQTLVRVASRSQKWSSSLQLLTELRGKECSKLPGSACGISKSLARQICSKKFLHSSLYAKILVSLGDSPDELLAESKTLGLLNSCKDKAFVSVVNGITLAKSQDKASVFAAILKIITDQFSSLTNLEKQEVAAFFGIGKRAVAKFKDSLPLFIIEKSRLFLLLDYKSYHLKIKYPEVFEKVSQFLIETPVENISKTFGFLIEFGQKIEARSFLNTYSEKLTQQTDLLNTCILQRLEGAIEKAYECSKKFPQDQWFSFERRLNAVLMGSVINDEEEIKSILQWQSPYKFFILGLVDPLLLKPHLPQIKLDALDPKNLFSTFLVFSQMGENYRSQIESFNKRGVRVPQHFESYFLIKNLNNKAILSSSEQLLGPFHLVTIALKRRFTLTK